MRFTSHTCIGRGSEEWSQVVYSLLFSSIEIKFCGFCYFILCNAIVSWFIEHQPPVFDAVVNFFSAKYGCCDFCVCVIGLEAKQRDAYNRLTASCGHCLSV